MFQCQCHRAAVLSDIHSNVWALKACLADAREQGADCFIFLGDFVSGLSAATQTMDVIYQLRKKYPTWCIRGNRERYMLEQQRGQQVCVPGSHTGTMLFTYQQLRPKDLEFFRSLPFYDRIQINGVTMDIAHATMEQDRYLFVPGDDRICHIVEQMEQQYLLCGHSHMPYQYQAQGKTIFNPGSVGQPQGAGHQAQYALLDVQAGGVCWSLQRVDYDVEAMICSQFQSGLTQMGKCWAISDLYGALTGEKTTAKLLGCMFQHPESLEDEQLWQQTASSLGMAFTMEEILDFWRGKNK
jgi:predicted phosphodiesterase